MATELRVQLWKKKKKKGKRVSDKTLLRIFLVAVVMVAFSIVIMMPLTLLVPPTTTTSSSLRGETNGNNAPHGVHQVVQQQQQQQQKTSTTQNDLHHPNSHNGTTTTATANTTNYHVKYDHKKIKKPRQQPPKKKKRTAEEIQQAKAFEEETFDNNPVLESFVPYHVVFSTGCSIFQDWQSYVFIFHIFQSGQEGHVTRVVSGCKQEDIQPLKDVWEKDIVPIAPGKVHLHFTPNYQFVKRGTNFKYFNKPMGMRHWMEHAMGYQNTTKGKNNKHDGSIVILMDPDQIMVRPFTNDFTNASEIWKKSFHLKVEHGSPFAQQYGFGLQWMRKLDPTKVFDSGKTPISNLANKDAFAYYMAMGPPYVATAKDMYAIVELWASIVVRVHDHYPHLLAEMFGYNLAAAHLELRHTIAHSFMVSDVYSGGEGWKLVHAVDAKDVCYNFPISEYPHVIHYCHRYFLGKYFISKYSLRKDFISCEAPLLMVPPGDIVKYNTAITPEGRVYEFRDKEIKMEAFMLCVMINALNQAAIYYKDTQCDKETANYEYSYTFQKNMTMPGEEPVVVVEPPPRKESH